MVVKVEGRKLIVEIHLDETAGMTGNGNILVASTRGWKKVEQDVSLSLNVVRKV